MTGRRYRIFISHSANSAEEPDTQGFLDSLCERLAVTPEAEVMLDQRSLQAGDDWCQRLYSWIGLCDTAVVVLSPRAVKRENSIWVPREVNLLMWRKALDPNFKIIPVLVSGLQRSEISDNPFVADVGLTELQFADALTSSQKIDAICEAIESNIKTVSKPTVFDSIQIFVEDSISRYAPQTSVETALATHYEDEPWKPYRQVQELLALMMVKHATASGVDDVIIDVARGSQPEFNLGARLFQVLFPMRLPADLSCSLLALCHQQVGQGAVIVNCHDTWAVRMLLRAATGQLEDNLLRTWRIIELPGGWGDDDEEEITQYISIELAESVLGTGGWDYLCGGGNPQGELTSLLSEFSKDSGTPILICARYSARWVQLAPRLASKFPATVFLLWSGDTMPKAFELGVGGVVKLDPCLPEGSDRHWNLRYRKKLQLLGTYQ